MRFIGIVSSGTGDAAAFLQTEGYRKQFEKRLGFTPFPGTLNVLVGPEQIVLVKALRESPGIFIERFKQGEREYWPVNAYRATLQGHAVVILFPERSRYGSEVLELISPDNLREKLKLADGDKVEIVIE